MKYQKETQKTRVIVKYRSRKMTKEQSFAITVDAIESMGGEVIRDYHSINAIAADIPTNKIGKLQLDPNVEYIEIDQEVHILGFPSPIVRTYAEQIPWGISKIKADQVQQSGNTGSQIKVCVIDTGIDYNHEDLKPNYKGGYNFVANTPDPKDDHGHGTHVSGTIAAIRNNEIGVVGVAPEAYIYSCKVLDANGSGSYSNVIAGIQWAIDNKMQVISMSLGGSSSSQALKDACDAAYNSNIVIIAAAGNSGCGSNDTVSYPAKYDSCIAIAATDSADQKASFSSCGPKVELAAPGVNVLSTVPKGTCKMCDPSGYRQANGTSMATPHVSGTVALILKAHPDWTNVQVRQVLQDSAVDLGNQGRDIYFGYGLVDALKATGGETPPPPKKYKCLVEEGIYCCIEDPDGPYNTIEECQNVCKETPPPPPKKYRCTPDYQCIEDPNGPYTIEECQRICKKPTPSQKWRCAVKIIWECVESKTGYNTKEECEKVCNTKNKAQNTVNSIKGCCD